MTIRTVTIRTVPPEQQRYDTIGDWIEHPDQKLEIIISHMDDWRTGIACAIHELVEAALCVHDHIAEARVSRFDSCYEDLRRFVAEPYDAEAQKNCGTAYVEKCIHIARLNLLREFDCDCTPTADSEPGEDLHAPYRRQHAVADGVERLFAAAIGLPWADYEDAAARASAAFQGQHD